MQIAIIKFILQYSERWIYLIYQHVIVINLPALSPRPSFNKNCCCKLFPNVEGILLLIPTFCGSSQHSVIPATGPTPRRTAANHPLRVSLAEVSLFHTKKQILLWIWNPSLSNPALCHVGSTSPCNSDDERKQRFMEKGTVLLKAARAIEI